MARSRASRLLLARAKGKLLAARRERRPIPAIDETLYVGWNAMFVSAYLEAARVLDRADCRAFALKTLDRILAEAWDESKGFLHRVGGPRLEGSLDDQVFAIAALLDAWEATLDRRYFEIAERAMRLAVERFGDPDGGGFFDRAKDAAPMGGLEVRRKPLQDSPTPGGKFRRGDRPRPPVRAHRREALSRLGGENSRSLRRPGPAIRPLRRDLRLAALLHARHPLQVVITGAAGDPKAAELEKAANEVYRFGKSVLRVAPGHIGVGNLPPALRETVPHLNAHVPQALVCVETTCQAPVADAAKLASLLLEVATTLA